MCPWGRQWRRHVDDDDDDDDDYKDMIKKWLPVTECPSSSQAWIPQPRWALYKMDSIIVLSIFFMMMHIMIIKPSSSSVEPESPLCKLAGLNSRPWSRRWCPFLPRWTPTGHRPWCPLEKAIMREQQWPIMIIIVIIIIKGVIRFTYKHSHSS